MSCSYCTSISVPRRALQPLLDHFLLAICFSKSSSLAVISASERAKETACWAKAFIPLKEPKIFPTPIYPSLLPQHGFCAQLFCTLTSPDITPKDIFLGQALQDGHGVRLELHQRLALTRAADLGLPFALLCDSGVGLQSDHGPTVPALPCSQTAPAATHQGSEHPTRQGATPKFCPCNGTGVVAHINTFVLTPPGF